MSDHAKEDERLLDLIRDSYVDSHGVYGARRVFGDLHPSLIAPNHLQREFAVDTANKV